MIVVVIVIHLILVLAMIAVILLQKSEGGGLVSSTSGFMTGRGTANVLTRTTAILAFFFFITSLGLSWYAGLGRHPASIINPGAPATQQPSPGGNAPLAPLSQGSGGVLNQLGGGKAPEAAAPSAPSEPQVPQSK
jgi:preprotein translocase subunit SecG